MGECEVRAGGRVLIADDHPLTREGLALAARSALTGATVFTAGSVTEAVATMDHTRIDRMILLDLMLPDARGYSGLMSIQHHAANVPIVIVSAREEPALIEAARAIGAAGFLFKSLPLDVVAGHLREIDEGRQVFSGRRSASPPAIGTDLIAIRRRIGELSPAQRTVLVALADGRSNKAIAHDLDITEATVKAHLTGIFRKLGVSNRAQALIAVQPLFGAGEGRDT